MNKYRVNYLDEVKKQLKKLDKSESKKITDWINKNLIDTTDPRQHGKPLQGNLKSYWRYRVDKYRLLAIIQDDELIILMVTIDKRDKVYK